MKLTSYITRAALAAVFSLAAAVTSATAATLDVGVAYSTDARKMFGGHAQIQAQIAAHMQASNRVYANSRTATRLRHVGNKALRGRKSSFFEIMEDKPFLKWAEKKKCDVLLVVDLTKDDFFRRYLGMAAYWAHEGGSLVGSTDIASNFINAKGGLNWRTMAHEIGHNLSLLHNEDAFLFTDQWRIRRTTVMALNKRGEYEIPYFSNPSVEWKGFKLGNNRKNSAKKIRQWRWTVANIN